MRVIIKEQEQWQCHSFVLCTSCCIPSQNSEQRVCLCLLTFGLQAEDCPLSPFCTSVPSFLACDSAPMGPEFIQKVSSPGTTTKIWSITLQIASAPPLNAVTGANCQCIETAVVGHCQ